jgi:hypothetical protein
MKLPARTVLPALLVSGLIMSTMATSCFIRSAVVLTPSPSAPASIRARVVASIDSVVKPFGLTRRRPWDYCTVRGVAGVPEAAWSRGDVGITACSERAQPSRIEIKVRQPGIVWCGRAKQIRHELPDALRMAFGAESVVVAVDPK